MYNIRIQGIYKLRLSLTRGFQSLELHEYKKPKNRDAEL